MPKRSGNGIIIKNVGAAVKKAAPTLLTFIGSTGVIVTAVLTAKATPKALEQIKEAEAVKISDENEPLTKVETIKACWKCYIPSAIVVMTTIGSIIGANVLNKRQQASLMATYAFLDQSFRKYKNSVKEVFGEEGHNKVMQNMMVEHPEAPAIYGNCWGEPYDFGPINDEKHMFFDALSQRYFSSTFSDVLLAELHTNRNLAINGCSIPCSMYYDFLGLDTPEELRKLSWFLYDDYSFIDFVHSKTLIDDGPENDPIECWVIEMPFPPTIEPCYED